MDPVPDTPHVAIPCDGHVEGNLEAVAVEAVECGRCWTTRQHVTADVEHQRTKLRKRVGRSTREPERIDAHLEEGTARDSAPKLCIGDTNAVRLLP